MEPNDRGLDAGTLAYVHRMFDLARNGDSVSLAAEVDAGLPVNLTNGKGDSLLILAAYYNHPETVGADPHAGGPTAVEMAQFFEFPATLKLLHDGHLDSCGIRERR